MLAGLFWLLRRHLGPRSRLCRPAALDIGRRYLRGRERDLDNLLGRLRDFGLVRLVGESGVGKSCLLQQGLVPRLEGERSYLPVYLDHWGADWIEGPRQGLRRALDEELRERFLAGEARRILSPEDLGEANPFWRDLAGLLGRSGVRCVMVSRTDMQWGLESDGWVLPIRMKLAFRGLEGLRALTVDACEAEGGLIGLEALDLARHLHAAARGAGWPVQHVHRLLVAMVEPQSRHKRVAQGEDPLLATLPEADRDGKSLERALRSLRDADIVPQRLDPDRPAEPVSVRIVERMRSTERPGELAELARGLRALREGGDGARVRSRGLWWRRSTPCPSPPAGHWLRGSGRKTSSRC